jgi:hypothetical protein
MAKEVGWPHWCHLALANLANDVHAQLDIETWHKMRLSAASGLNVVKAQGTPTDLATRKTFTRYKLA